MEFGIQLYTLRKFMDGEKAFAETLDYVQSLGCKYIQLSGQKNVDYKVIKNMIDDRGLTITCSHSPFDRIKNDIDALAEEHIYNGIKTIGLGSMPKNYRASGNDDPKEFMEIMNKASEQLKKYDLNLSYHNHQFEFLQRLDGELLFDKMIKEMPDVQFILDTYWVYFAKKSIEEYIDKLNGRLLNVHLKDYRKILGLFPIMCEVGRGKLDFLDLNKRFEKEGTQYALIEQDVAKDPKKSVKQTWEYLKQIK